MNKLFILLLLLFNSTLGFSFVDSLSIEILQKTLAKHQSVKRIMYNYSYKSQTMDSDFHWKTIQSISGKSDIKNPGSIVEKPNQGEAIDNNQRLYFEALNTVQIALNSKNTRLSCGCSPLPYYVIDLNDVPYMGLNAKKYTAHKTVYIDTLTYLIHAITSVETLDSGVVQLSTFTMDSVIAYFKEVKKEQPIFQLNKNMLQPGDIAPLFALKDPTGKPVNLADYKGKLVLLDFWYAACKPCIKASYNLEKLQAKYADRGLVILGMNTMDKPDKIKRHNKKHDITYRSVVCTREVKAKYKIKSYPSFYLIDQTGKIVFSTSGYSGNLASELESAILQAFSNR